MNLNLIVNTLRSIIKAELFHSGLPIVDVQGYCRLVVRLPFRTSCAGTLNEGSLYVDHHFTKRFDGFVGIAYSWVSGGLAIAIPHGPGVPYNSNHNFAPTVGGRFSF